MHRAWLHADFHPGNVIFADDQVRAVLDFDVVHHGFRLEDVAYAISRFCPPGDPGTASCADGASGTGTASGTEALKIFLQALDLIPLERRAPPTSQIAVRAVLPRDTGCASEKGSAAQIFLQALDLIPLERRALPYFIVAVQARTAARYRVREREGTDPREALRTHVRRMRALGAAGGLDVGPLHHGRLREPS